MGSKAAGVTGGILCLLGAAGLFALWWFFIGPYIALNGSTADIQNMIFWILSGIPALTGTPIITDPNVQLLLTQIMAIAGYLQVMNGLSGIDILGVGIPLMIWVIGDVGLIALGGILGIAGAGED